MRARILETAVRLGYTGPDPIARGLRQGRAGIVGVIYDTRLAYAFQNGAAVAVLGGLAEVTEAEGISLALVPGSSADARSCRDHPGRRRWDHRVLSRNR